MDEVESLRNCKYYSKQFYSEIILVFTTQKIVGIGQFIGQNQSQGPCVEN